MRERERERQRVGKIGRRKEGRGETYLRQIWPDSMFVLMGPVDWMRHITCIFLLFIAKRITNNSTLYSMSGSLRHI